MKELAIIGTTASGKTALALKLASEFNGVILSLDSLCIYKFIDIASAKPTADELASVPHFGVNLLMPDEHFDVGMFFEVYKTAREFAQKNGKNLFITGGSGFYLKALLSGLTPKFERVKSGLSNAQIYELVSSLDPEFAAKFSANDTYRLQKWFDIYSFLRSSGRNDAVSAYLRENTLAPVASNFCAVSEATKAAKLGRSKRVRRVVARRDQNPGRVRGAHLHAYGAAGQAPADV